jgi:hypothetical protein
MFARKSKSKNGKSLPQDWIESFSRLLNESYKKECQLQDRYFDVYGQIYPDELVITTSWLSEKDEYSAPITCFLSCEPDQIKDEKRLKETQSDYIDVVGLFFDEIFASSEWNEFEPNWQELKYKNHTYFFKLTRENINLTLEANKLLGDEFLNELEDEETNH